MSVRLATDTRDDKANQGPAWGLKAQLGRLPAASGKKGGSGPAGRATNQEDREKESKILPSITGPALAEKIQRVRYGRSVHHTLHW